MPAPRIARVARRKVTIQPVSGEEEEEKRSQPFREFGSSPGGGSTRLCQTLPTVALSKSLSFCLHSENKVFSVVMNETVSLPRIFTES